MLVKRLCNWHATHFLDPKSIILKYLNKIKAKNLWQNKSKHSVLPSTYDSREQLVKAKPKKDGGSTSFLATVVH